MMIQVSPESTTIAMLSRPLSTMELSWALTDQYGRAPLLSHCQLPVRPEHIAALVTVDREAFVRLPEPARPGWAKSQEPTRLSLRNVMHCCHVLVRRSVGPWPDRAVR